MLLIVLFPHSKAIDANVANFVQFVKKPNYLYLLLFIWATNLAKIIDQFLTHLACHHEYTVTAIFPPGYIYRRGETGSSSRSSSRTSGGPSRSRPRPPPCGASICSSGRRFTPRSESRGPTSYSTRCGKQVRYSTRCRKQARNSTRCGKQVRYSTRCGKQVVYSTRCGRQVRYSTRCGKQVRYSTRCGKQVRYPTRCGE